MARYQHYDWDEGQLAEWHTIDPGGLVVIEGVSSCREAFRPYLSLSIWVDAPRELRLQRRLERDGAAIRDVWLGWTASEDVRAEREHPRAHADLTISGVA